jgi:hypothetical protein
MINTRVTFPLLLLIGFLTLLLVAPSHLALFSWDGQSLVEVPDHLGELTIPIEPPVDLDGNGQPETVNLEEGKVEILSDGQPMWNSPADWEVSEIEIADLNQDGTLEVALLVWRVFSSWPIDAYLPRPGRIQDFHDQDHRSCHLILIGWSRGAYRELWAGSALVDPISAISAIDINHDGLQEIVALESRYDAHVLETNQITVWEWNGFGFTLLSRGPKGYFQSLNTVKISTGQSLLLAQGILRR